MMISRADAIEIARSRAAEKNWAFAEPLDVVHRRGWFGAAGRFEIETNAGMRGTRAHFVIDAKTGAILSEGYLPR
jgi:Peptidase propeptide and YPEB domain